jgi:hypothetical protein
MTQLVILLAIVLVPVLIITVLRANGAIAFMSLCVGSVLATYTSTDAATIVSSFSAGVSEATTKWVQLALLVAPFLLAMLFTRGSVHGSKQFMNFLPALASGMLFALLAIPLFSATWQHQLEAQAFWHQLDSLQTAIVLAGAAFSLLFILMSHRTRSEGGKHSKH